MLYEVITYALTERMMPWLTGLFILLVGAGLYGGLYLAPPDYQQGDSYRIIYIHVPSAWTSFARGCSSRRASYNFV